MPIAQRREAANPSDFVVDGLDESAFDVDDEDVRPSRSSALQGGWEAALKASKTDKKFTNEFSFTEDAQLVKFIGSEPFAVFGQHWVERAGKRSFVCLQDEPDGCPLCDKGDTPRTKVAFSVVNLSAEDPKVEMLLCSPTLTRILASLANDPKTGPLDRICYALSRTGKGTKVAYQVTPVSPRVLDEWSVTQEEIDRLVEPLEPLAASVISVTPRSELLQIAREIVR